MEKSFTRNEGHPLSLVNLGKHLLEKEVVTFAQAKAGLAHALIISSWLS